MTLHETKALRAAGKILPGVVLAVLLTLGLEFAHGMTGDWAAAFERMRILEFEVVVLGMFLVWSLIVLLHAVTNRFWVAGGIVTALVVVVAAADHYKMHFRQEPLFATDAAYLSQFGFLIETVGTAAAVAIIGAVLLIPFAFWAVGRSRLVRRRRDRAHTPSAPTRAARRRATLVRLVAGTAAATVVFSAASFNEPGNATRQLYDATDVRWAPWNQRQNYNQNGFIAGLLYSMPTSAMEEPDGYSEEVMADLVERYSARAAELNATRNPAALEDTNVVVVLWESHSDPLKMGISAAEDPLPFLRELMAENTSGTMIAAGVGGGTSNAEFEVLTGMAAANLHPQVSSPFQSLVSESGEFPSHLTTFGKPKRDTAALHPYLGSFYRRNAVYPALGFERFRFLDELGHLEKLPKDGFVSDAAIFNEAVNELRDSERPLVLNVVTMQNHIPQKGFADPIAVEGPLLTDGLAETAGQYLRGLKHSDDALRQFVDDINALDERTIVLMYGDHLPTLWPEDILAAAGETARFETPWVVFANFPTENLGPQTLGPNQLMNQVIDAAGAPHTPWTALLHEVGTEIPAMEPTRWIGPDGEVTSEAELTERGQGLLADYRLAQYDLAVGERWAAGPLLSP